MKKVLAIFTAAILTLGLTACGAKTDAPISDTPAPSSQIISTDPVQSDVPDTDVSSDIAAGDTSSKQEKPASSKQQTPASSKQQTPSQPTATLTEFYNPNNNFYDKDAVVVRPRHLYWKDGKLVAECFVINGYDFTVSNINVKYLIFSNAQGEIVNGGFGVLQGLVLQPRTHGIWTFTFSGDAVTKYGADLRSIQYNSRVTTG